MDLSQEEWTKKLMQDVNSVVLDVRTVDECREGIILGALMIDIFKGQGFVYSVDTINKSKNIYVYCRSGVRSHNACSIMNQMGFAHTYNLVGGFSNWQGEVAYPNEEI